MRKCRLLLWAFLTIPILCNIAKAQSDHSTYAITSEYKGGSEWIALRTIDMRTGNFSPVLLKVQDTAHAIIPVVNASGYLFAQKMPGASIAALAYDRKFNRLYYTPMKTDQLRCIDLSTMDNYAVSVSSFSSTGGYDSRNTGPVNRMVIAPDNFGYIITNDGTHLMRFSTEGTPLLKDLGDLADDPLNKEMSIHSICANSGGDMVADDDGHLLLITGYNHVYQVDIASRRARFLATISGLPQKFTTSGAAVSEDGKQIIITSNAYTESYFSVDPQTWNATGVSSSTEIFETADLANSNMLITKSNVFAGKSTQSSDKIRIFPNPVLDDKINIQFTQLPAGKYTIQLSNATGTKLKQQTIVLTGYTQTESMFIPHIPQGFYYVQIVNEKNAVVSVEKLVVERW